MKNPKLPKISMEAIAYQPQSTFLFDIASIITDLRSRPRFTQTELDACGLREIVFKRTGMLVYFVINDVYPRVDQSAPMVVTNNNASVPKIGPNSAFYKSIAAMVDATTETTIATHYQARLRACSQLTTLVDLKRGRISGAFSEIPAHILLDGLVLSQYSPLSVDEAAAVIVHELGHIWSFFDTIGQTTAANSITVTALDALKETPVEKLRIQLVAQALTAFGAPTENAELIATEENPQTQHLLMIRTFADHSQAEARRVFGDHGIANYRSIEFTADQFAVRHTGAVMMASVVDKLSKYERSGYQVSAAKYYGVEAVRYSLVVGGLFTPLWPVAAIIATVCGIVSVTMSKEEDRVPNPMERMGAIKQDLVQLLKHRQLPADQRKQILHDIELVDTLRQNAKEHDSFARFVWKNIAPAGRQQRKLRDFQNGLDDLINNKLFIQASRFKTA